MDGRVAIEILEIITRTYVVIHLWLYIGRMEGLGLNSQRLQFHTTLCFIFIFVFIQNAPHTAGAQMKRFTSK